MTREEQIQDACDAHYDETWDEHGGKAMVVDDCHDIWFPSQATDDFFKAGVEWADQHNNEAFIEKACEWLKDNYPYYFETDIEQEFKKAMKGE